MSDKTLRRVLGVIYGAMLGLAFSSVTQLINFTVVPDIPLYHPPFGPAGNIALFTVAGAVVGLIGCWLESSLISVIIAGFLSSIVLELAGSLTGEPLSPDQAGRLFFTLLILVMPMTGLLGVFIGAFRWIVNQVVDGRHFHHSRLRRSLLPIGTVLLLGGLGLMALLPPEGQQRVTDMHALIQAGLQANSADALPAPLRGRAVDEFLTHATPEYTLQYVRSELINWRIGQPVEYQEWQLLVVAARFNTGWVLACLYTPDDQPPNCRSFDRDPLLPPLS